MLGPRGPVPPDGFGVALVKRDAAGQAVPFSNPAVSADGADLRPAMPMPPLQTFLVVPRPGAKEIRIRASDGALKTEQRFRTGPPAARVELALEPANPVKGRDTHAVLTVRLLNPDGTPDAESAPPVLRANVGTLERLEPTGPGAYRAQYVLPKTRYPEVAIVAALAPWPHPHAVHGVFGRLLVPLASAIDLPGRTERNAQMSIEIANRTYGPVQSGPDGRFLLPVVVPPGHRFGQGLAVDRLGNRRTAKIDLMLPPTDQLACVVNPPRLPADGISRARVLCATSDPYGKPVTSAKVNLSARKGSVAGPRPIEGGMLEWIYTAPRVNAFEPDGLIATWPAGGPSAREELAIALEQGPAAKLTLEAPEPLVHRGAELPLTMRVQDGLDRPRPDAALELWAADGTLARVREVAPGRFEAAYVPQPEGEPREVTLRARAYGPDGSGPARLWAWARDGHVFAGVADLTGLPIAHQRVLADGKAFVTGADGSADLGPARPGVIDLQHDEWPGLRLTLFVLDERRVYPYGPPPGSREQQLTVTVAPPTPVNVRVQVDGRRVTYWVEDPRGALLPGRAVEVALSGGRRGADSERGGKTSFEVSASAPITVSIADRATGVTALAEVKP